MARNVPKIEIHSIEIHPPESYPAVTVWGVEISTNDGVWLESFAAEAEVRAFLRGLQAGSQMTGGPYFPLPNIPHSQ